MSEEVFTIELAGRCIGIKPRNDRLARFCKNYLKDGEPEIVFAASDSDIEEENQRAIEYLGWGDTSENELERLSIYRKIAEYMPSKGVFLMHSSALVVDGQAYLFAGPSGAGKTTQTKMWKKEFKERMRVINDDKPLIMETDKEILVCGSPWCGKERWNNNITAPLKGVIFIHQAKENSIREMSAAESWEALANQVYRSKDGKTMKRILGFIDRVISDVPIYRLECNRKPEAVSVAFEKVSGGAKK